MRDTSALNGWGVLGKKYKHHYSFVETPKKKKTAHLRLQSRSESAGERKWSANSCDAFCTVIQKKLALFATANHDDKVDIFA